MRILITGGAGCLGSNLIEYFIPRSVPVLSIDNYATGKREVLPEVSGLTVVEGSISDYRLVDQCFASFKPTHVINSAASYKDPTDWESDSMTNTTGAINIAKACLDHNVEAVINFQTALIYGRPDIVPIPISHATRPITSYGVSKLAGEQYLLMLRERIKVTSLRLANICGPRLAIGPIPTFYTRLKQGKSCFCSDSSRDFLDISDFFSLIDTVLLDSSEPGVYNVSSGVGTSIKEIFDIVVEYLGVELSEPVPIVAPSEDDIAVVVLDPAETYEKLAWRSEVNVRDTITRMLQWYDQFGVSDIYSHLKPSDQ